MIASFILPVQRPISLQFPIIVTTISQWIKVPVEERTGSYMEFSMIWLTNWKSIWIKRNVIHNRSRGLSLSFCLVTPWVFGASTCFLSVEGLHATITYMSVILLKGKENKNGVKERNLYSYRCMPTWPVHVLEFLLKFIIQVWTWALSHFKKFLNKLHSSHFSFMLMDTGIKIKEADS